jgi:hypothetical protein
MDHTCTVRELVEKFGMKELAVQESLAALRMLNLVKVSEDKPQPRYSFDVKALFALNRQILSRENEPSIIDNLDEEDRKMLRPFFQGDRILEIPLNQKKFRVLVSWLVTQFDTGVRYTEKQVNEIISRYHEDYATLRRALIDQNLMQREKGVYWRVSQEG